MGSDDTPHPPVALTPGLTVTVLAAVAVLLVLFTLRLLTVPLRVAVQPLLRVWRQNTAAGVGWPQAQCLPVTRGQD